MVGTAAALFLGTVGAQAGPEGEPRPHGGATAAAVAALSDGDTAAALEVFPAGFEPAMHYRPVTEDGILVDPLGAARPPSPCRSSSKHPAVNTISATTCCDTPGRWDTNRVRRRGAAWTPG